MTPDRCPTCDRDGCEWWTFGTPSQPKTSRVNVSEIDGRTLPSNCLAQNAFDDCGRHRVDWRSRALAAEARIATVAATIEHDIAICRGHQSARATGGQTVGTGGALTAAQPSLLAYLERVVRDLHDERTRSVAADAAKWRRVAPLIEDLRAATTACEAMWGDDEPAEELVGAVNHALGTLLAATPDKAIEHDRSGETP